MRPRFITKFVLVSVAWTPFIKLNAQTDVARELKQAQEVRQQALTAAEAPIDARYEQTLEQLLRRATLASDLDIALKIKAALQSLSSFAKKELAGRWTLLADTGYTSEVVLRSDGTGTDSQNGRFQWRLVGDSVYLGSSDKADHFDLPVKDGKMSGANSIRNKLTLTRK